MVGGGGGVSRMKRNMEGRYETSHTALMKRVMQLRGLLSQLSWRRVTYLGLYIC